jgi:drug/metabolite transporter (DMT)-like permease
VFNLLLSILFSVALLLIFRLFPRFGVRTFQAIAFNYLTCVGVGLGLLPAGATDTALGAPYLPLALGLGVCFLVSFFVTSLITQRIGVTVASLATNLSLVIPVLISLLFFGQSDLLRGWNYAGLALALLAVGFSSVAPRPAGPRVGTDETMGAHPAWLLALPAFSFLLNGFVNTMTNFINVRYTPDDTVFIELAFTGAALSASVLFGIQLLRGQQRLHAPSVIGGVVLGLSNYTSYLFLVRALADFGQNGALLFPLYNVGVIGVSAAAAVGVFRERLSRWQVLGLVLAVGAMGLLLA